MQKPQWQQLEQLLGDGATTRTITPEQWELDGGQRHPEAGDKVELGKGIRFVTRIAGSEVHVLETDKKLTALEQELISMLLQQTSGKTMISGTEVERQARKLGEWIGQCAAAGDWLSEVPDRLELRSRLLDGMIPFLLLREQAEDKEPSYTELDKAVRSFITDDTLLIPLREHEWLILSPDRMLAETDAADDEVVESQERKVTLASLGSGLYQMVTGEWGGDCHVAVGEPIDPTESVLHTVGVLRETIQLGRKFHVGMQVHLPWLVHLERLLSGIPEAARVRFVEEMIGRPDLFNDTETVSTLDAFFSMDCNVSETAKKLFIHRNTLLYRLDKIKQEAGLDVRSFNDAVLVRILLLLYKVTKRK